MSDAPETATTRSVTIVFGDVIASSSMVAEFGDLAFATALRSFFQRVHDLQAAHRGEFVKSLGDSFLIVFADTDDAVAFAMDIQRSLARDPIRVSDIAVGSSDLQDLRLRIGIHHGSVLLTETVYGREILGTAVNLVARLTARARPGGVVLSQSAKARLSEEHRTNLRIKSVSVEIKHAGTIHASTIDILDEDDS